jgi:peptide/nickel transport system substrate-binding protein
MRRSTSSVFVALAAATSWVATGAAGPQAGVREGGTFRVALFNPAVQSIDPFLNRHVGWWSIRSATCGSLLNHRDEGLPAGRELRPELGEGFPQVSNGGKTYTFSVARGHRFSTGAAVTARDVAATVRRALRLEDSSAAPGFLDVVGARAFSAGRASKLTGVTVAGNRIRFLLTKPQPDFDSVAGTLCIFPANLPLIPEGVRAPVPSAGPYMIARHVLGRQIVLERNRFYRGPRPHRVDRFDVTIVSNDSTAIEDVGRGRYDWAWVRPDAWRSHVPGLVARYGINRGRFFVTRGRGLCMLTLNASRPLFGNNPRLRRAVNYALDRRALLREAGGRHFGVAADQYLQPHQPAYRPARIYPSRPDVRKARELARGNTRGGKAVFYTRDAPLGHAYGAIVRANLAKIGLDVEVKAFPALLSFEKIGTRGEPFDIGWICWLGAAPGDLSLHDFFDGRTLEQPQHSNYSHFNAARVNRRLDAVSRLRGPAFQRGYGALDIELARDYAPAATYAYLNELTLVSARTGCVVNNPFFNLAAVCLK